MALNRTDKLLAGWIGLVTVVALTRSPVWTAQTGWLLLAHGLFVVLLWLFAHGDAEAQGWHDFYPLLLLPLLYAEVGLLNDRLGLEHILRHDQVIQHLEQSLFGIQVSVEWIRRHPSLLWSNILHGAYLFYYPIIFGGPPLVLLRRSRADARYVVFAMMCTFVVCYTVFLLYPVAGPSYAFPQPLGAVRDVAMARLVYAGLASASSVGCAFPSSHVAATIAVTVAVWRVWPKLGMVFVIPAALLTVGTVYTQMHYLVDASAGLLVGAAVPLVVELKKRGADKTMS